MTRLTRPGTDGGYAVDAAAVSAAGGGCTGAAIDRLAAFENFCEALQAEQLALAQQLEELRKAGKDRSCKFRELMGRKLVGSNIITRLQLSSLMD